MRHLVISAVVATSLLVPAAVMACGGQGQSTMAKQDKLAPEAATSCAENARASCADQSQMAVRKVSIDELAGLQKASKVRVLDVNSRETREKMGVIPGAMLLTSTQYDPSKELPSAKDSNLVFYCYNEQCRASHQAALRAVEAGYTQVSVLPVGITGWQKAGQKTVKPGVKQI